MTKFTPALTLVVCLASAAALPAQEMTKLLGKWERKIGKNRVTLTVEDHRLHVTYAGEKTGTLHADYSVTHDGVIYGVVTSIECDEDEEAEATKTLFDAPFSFRFRIDEGALIIHDAKSHDADSKDDVWNGRFKAAGPAATHGTVVPTSYYSTPIGSPYTAPSPPCPIGSSFSTPSGVQTFQFWTGFSR
jgi:hypothetical protein